MTTRVVHRRRESLTALPLYFSGHLLKKRSKEKAFTKYFAELRGATLFLYNDDTQGTYTEKLDLEQLKSMDLDSSYQKEKTTTFTLKLPTEDVQLKMDSADTGEMWRGYILTVGRKEVPSKLKLLPGQILQLQETLAQERRRNGPGSHPPIPRRPAFLQHPASGATCSSADMPECFFDVTRQEAEKMLEENPEYGGIILRPSTMANNYALTLRLLTPSGPVMKNFRVTSTKSGFVIELEKAVTVPTLKDVLKYFLQKTEYRLRPYMASQPYATRIEAVPAPNPVGINAAADKKTVPKAQVSPMLRSQSKQEILPSPEKPEEGDGDGEYVYPDDQNLKPVQLAIELRTALEQRRQNVYVSSAEEDGRMNEVTTKSPSSRVSWTNTSGDSKA